jgi:phage nucleotide-binding protein
MTTDFESMAILMGNTATPPANPPEPSKANLKVVEPEVEADEILEKLLSRIGSVDSQSSKLNVMLYGQPGVGKTVWAASAPSWLLINVEKGAGSLKEHPDRVGPNCQVLEYRSLVQLETLLSYMEKSHPAFAKYETIIIDSYSELQKRDLDEIVASESRKDVNRNKFLPIGPDYNVNTEHMRQLAMRLRDIDKHVIVICHVKEEKDDNTGRIMVRPNLTPKLASSMAGIFDVVAYLQRTEGPNNQSVRTLQVHPTLSVLAKTRIGNLPPVMEDATFSTLLNAYINTTEGVNNV